VAAVPSIGRASRVERPAAPGADAATQLYERYSAQIFGYCFHQLGSREEAEDAVQTTFMNAFRGLARGIVPEAEQAWVFKIAHNVCRSRRRSSWRRGRIEAPNNLEVLQEVVPAKEKVADELIELQDVLEGMPESQRRAILLREWQGLSYREIADELELSQGAVETLIFRARRSLAAGLEKAPGGRAWRKRLRRGADVGGVLAFLKTALGGGGAAAVKVATIVALTGAAVATTAADHMRPLHRAATKAPAAAATSPVRDVTRPRSTPPTVVEAVHRVVPRRDAVRRVAPRHRQTAHAPRRRPTKKPAPVKVEKPVSTPRPAAPPEPPPAPPPATDEPVPSSAPSAPKPEPVKPPKGHGKSPKPADPAPAAASDEGNPGKGHDKDEVAPPPALETPPAAADPEGNSGNHGQNTAPGQQDKADKDKGGNGGNGHGK
jgi:RNA polymerase sigma factor (sigma-70 family)